MQQRFENGSKYTTNQTSGGGGGGGEGGRGGQQFGAAPGADVRDVWLPSHKHLSTAKITQLELVCLCVDQQVLWLDVSMAHLHAVDVCQRSAHLQQARPLLSKTYHLTKCKPA